MMNRLALLACVGLGSLVLTVGGCADRPPQVVIINNYGGPADVYDDSETIEQPGTTTVSTADFETGRRALPEMSSRALEALLQDLNRRKDYALQVHNGQGTPGSEYLWAWVQRVSAELQARGYRFDSAGRLFCGHREVAVR